MLSTQLIKTKPLPSLLDTLEHIHVLVEAVLVLAVDIHEIEDEAGTPSVLSTKMRHLCHLFRSATLLQLCQVGKERGQVQTDLVDVALELFLDALVVKFGHFLHTLSDEACR